MSIFVEIVGSYAFFGCSQLTGPLTFSSNLEEIGDYAFYGCTNFNGDLHLGFGLRRVGSFAFYRCSRLTGSLRLGYRKTSISYPPYDDYNRIYRQCRVDDFTFYECT